MKFSRRIARMLRQADVFGGMKADRLYESESERGEVGAYWFSPEKIEGGASARYVWMSADRTHVCFLFGNRKSEASSPIYLIHDWSRQRREILTAMQDWLKPEIAI